MADPKFFHKLGPFTLAQLAQFAGAELHHATEPTDRLIHDVATLVEAGPADCSFFDNRRYILDFTATKAGVCVTAPAMASLAPPGLPLLLSPNPYRAYALIAQQFYPTPLAHAGIHPTAVIAPTARIDPSAEIGALASIAANAVIGAGCVIEPQAVIGAAVVIGPASRIMSQATITHAEIGARVVIYPGCRIGQPGFGFAAGGEKPVKVPQLGRVIIGDDVEIGANTTIDRGALGDTVIGNGTMIDNLVQIGHNVKIGRGCVIVSQVGISGSTVLADFVQLGGQAGVAGHLHLGKGAKVAAKSGVMRDIEPGQAFGGYPAMPIKQWHRQTAKLGQIAKMKTDDAA